MANLDCLRHANGSIPTAVQRLDMQKVTCTACFHLRVSVLSVDDVGAHNDDDKFTTTVHVWWAVKFYIPQAYGAGQGI